MTSRPRSLLTLTTPDSTLRRAAAITAARLAVLLPPGWYADLHLTGDGDIHVRPAGPGGAGDEALAGTLDHPALQGWRLAQDAAAAPCPACPAS
ncbi:hypothetical protein ABZ752_17475 [Streptomyces roseifaciens]